MMPIRLISSVLLLTLQLTAQAPRQGDVRPRLVVLVSVDQLADWVLRAAEPWFGEDGFRRLAREGVRFDRCSFRHGVTFTGPGHATLATGAPASLHGIVGNDWLDPATGQPVYCVADSRSVIAKGLTGVGALSPRNLLAPTLGDTLKAHLGARTRVVSMSWKDRSAILLGGHAANVAVWMDKLSGGFVTSSFYGAEAPAWLTSFVATQPARAYFGRRWERVGPDEAYADLVDDRPFESRDPAGGRTLPHVVDGGLKEPGAAFMAQLYASPFGNDLLLDLAQEALRALKLGQGAGLDLLCLGFSSNDTMGHLFGPLSVEVRDATLRTDRQLARLLKMLDGQVGPGRYQVILSADHGAAPAVAGLKGLRMHATDRRVAQRARQGAERAIRKRFGDPPEGTANWVLQIRGANLYLNRAAVAQAGHDLVLVQDAAASGALDAPGIAATLSQIRAGRGQVPHDPLHAALAWSVHPQRSGDVILGLAAFRVAYPGVVATHGSPHPYDRRVPLFVTGKGLRHGHRSLSPVGPGAGGVIVCHLLGIPKPAMAVDEVPADVLAR